MKIFKFNWGTGIALFYGCFVLALFVILWIGKDEDIGLISRDYYDLDLHYQERIDKIQNSTRLSKDLDITAGGDAIRIVFPEEVESPSGEIQMLRPADGRKDFKVPVKTTEGNMQVIPAASLDKGLWRISVDWTDRGVLYFKETYVMI